MGEYVLFEDITCLRGEHVLQKVMFYGRTCLKVGDHVSWEDMPFKRTYYVGMTGLFQVCHGLMCVCLEYSGVHYGVL